MHHYHFRTRFAFWLLVFLPFLEACSVSAPTAPTAALDQSSPAPPSSVSTQSTPRQAASPALNWLQKQPCAPPCWEGIQPGQTTPEQAKLLLSQNPNITGLDTATAYNGTPDHFFWNWKADANTANGGIAYYYLTRPENTTVPTQTITAISLFFQPPLSFQDLIAVYGEPSHIMVAAHFDAAAGILYTFGVVYLNQGLFLMDDRPNPQVKPVLESTTKFNAVTFFAPTTAGFDNAIEWSFPVHQPSTLLVPWQGFRPMQFYCRDTRPNPTRSGCS